MSHLSSGQIEAAAAGQLVPGSREHYSRCELCQSRAERASRIEGALAQLPRDSASPTLAARIIAALPATAPRRVPKRPSLRLGLAFAVAAALMLALVYQTAVDLSANGAFDLLSMYTSMPQIVTNYPTEALATLVDAVPWLQLLITFGALLVAVVLAQQFLTGAPASNGGRIRSRA